MWEKSLMVVMGMGGRNGGGGELGGGLRGGGWGLGKGGGVFDIK